MLCRHKLKSAAAQLVLMGPISSWSFVIIRIHTKHAGSTTPLTWPAHSERNPPLTTTLRPGQLRQLWPSRNHVFK